MTNPDYLLGCFQRPCLCCCSTGAKFALSSLAMMAPNGLALCTSHCPFRRHLYRSSSPQFASKCRLFWKIVAALGRNLGEGGGFAQSVM